MAVLSFIRTDALLCLDDFGTRFVPHPSLQSLYLCVIGVSHKSLRSVTLGKLFRPAVKTCEVAHTEKIDRARGQNTNLARAGDPMGAGLSARHSVELRGAGLPPAPLSARPPVQPSILSESTGDASLDTQYGIPGDSFD
jgi:hypothetical protein